VQHGLHILAAEVLDLLVVQEQNAFFHWGYSFAYFCVESA